VGNPVTDKHEGEWVLSADEVQAIGPDVLQGMSDAVRSGQRVDVNKIREAVGQPPRRGYESGTGAASTFTPRDFDRNAPIPDAGSLIRSMGAVRGTPGASDTPLARTPRSSMGLDASRGNEAEELLQRTPRSSLGLGVGLEDEVETPIQRTPRSSLGLNTDKNLWNKDLAEDIVSEAIPDETRKLTKNVPTMGEGDGSRYTGEIAAKGTAAEATPAVPQPGDAGGPPVYSPSTQDQLAMDYYLSRMGASQQAERAAEQQAAMQAGYGREAVQGMSAVGDVGRRSAMGQAVAGFAGEAANRAESRRQFEEQQKLRERADVRASEVHQNAMMNAAETDLYGYFQNANDSQPGYDWRNDSSASEKLQELWEQQGNSGQFTEEWADNQFGIATTSESEAWTNNFHSSPTYATAPATSTYDPETGEIAEYGKDWYDENIVPFMQKGLDLGFDIGFGEDDDGNFFVYDKASGTILDGDTNLTSITGGGGNGDGTYDWSDAGSVTDAVGAWTSFDGAGALAQGVTPEAMASYLESHEGRVPESEEDWNDWMISDHTYDVDDDDDVASAMTIIGLEPTLSAPVDMDQMKRYLIEKGGKIGSVTDYNEWASKAGNLSNVNDLLNGQAFFVSERDRAAAKGIVDAKVLLASRGDYQDDPEGWSTALSDAGFDSEEDLVRTANLMPQNYAGDVGFTTGRDVYGRETDVGADVLWSDYGDLQPREGTSYPHGFQLNPPSGLEAMASDLAGSVITIDGKQYAVNQDYPVTYATVESGKKHPDDDEPLWVRVAGVTVYDFETGNWMTYVPYHAAGNAKPAGEKVSVGAGPGVFKIDEMFSANEEFNTSGY
jgi:hypothetical protein